MGSYLIADEFDVSFGDDFELFECFEIGVDVVHPSFKIENIMEE